MPVSPSKIGWGKYLQYSGPFYTGSVPLQLGSNPTWEEKILGTITATEGGRFDAINAYDKCIISSGLIQWCEAGLFFVSDMLGVAMEHCPEKVLAALQPALDASNAEFKKNAKGRWRFHFKDARGEVDRLQEQQQLFLGMSDGVAWDDASKAHAKLWAACVANVWESKEAQKAQLAFTVPRLMSFAFGASKEILFGANTPKHNEGWVGAVRAGYLSFAANLPAVAVDHLQRAVKATSAEPFSEDWCIAILRQLTFGPNIAIYPHRYKMIRPVLEKFFGVDLPDFADDLKAWKEKALGPTKPVPGKLTLADFDEPREYQAELIAQGFDIGPAGADGVLGAKSKAAIVQFQQMRGLTPDGVVGPKTRQAFLDAAIERLARST